MGRSQAASDPSAVGRLARAIFTSEKAARALGRLGLTVQKLADGTIPLRKSLLSQNPKSRESGSESGWRPLTEKRPASTFWRRCPPHF